MTFAGACGGGPPDSAAAEGEIAAAGQSDAAPTTPPHIDDCEALAGSAVDDAHDAALLPVLCPDHSLDKAERRTVLLAARSPSEAALLVPMLAAEPDLQGLARLVAYERAGAKLPTELPSPQDAPVSPVTPEVLANVQLAQALLVRKGVMADDRTRADAYLAKVHIQALQQLGYARGRALPPFARLLAARALHHGRRFCTAYWQRRVLGLETLFADTEARLLELVLAAEQTDHAGDGALLAVERQRARRYVQRPGPRGRIERRLEAWPRAADPPTFAALMPLANELDRLLDQGFVDLAISRGLHVAAEAGSYGIDPMTDLLAELLAEKDLDEHESLLALRRKELRSRKPPPLAKGPRELEPLQAPPWPTRAQAADAAADWIRASQARIGFARKHALGRAVLQLLDRPDAAAELLDRVSRGEAGLDSFVPTLLATQEVGASSHLRTLRRIVQIETTREPADHEAMQRRSFALAARETDLEEP